MYSPIAIANFFIRLAQATGAALTPMQLVKLVYIAHGWYLARTGRPLISEGVQAWRYGPVVPSIYHAFKQFRDGQITNQSISFVDGEAVAPNVSDQPTAKFLESVWSAYKGFSGTQLSTMTHRDGTPWCQIWRHEKGSETRGSVIPNDLIKEHYEKLAQERGG